MSEHQQAVVSQDPTPEFPKPVIAVNEADYEFARVFQTLFPDIQCSHCFARFRLLFLAGLATGDRAYDSIGDIGNAESRNEILVWWAKQVEAAKEELSIEMKIASAKNNHCLHNDETQRNH